MSRVLKPIVMDVDTGTDDALAIIYAIGHPDVELRGISCVAGNVPLDQVVINTCKVLDAIGAGDIPVAAGAAEPLSEPLRRKSSSHGLDGLAGIQLPDTPRRPSPLTAVDLLHQLIMDSAQPVTLVTLAPKTNLALLLKEHPDIAAQIEMIIFMGGAVNGRTAEFNVWQDPEAAAYLIESAIPTAMYGLDMFERLIIERHYIDRFRAHDHPAIRLAGELLQRRSGHNGPNQRRVGLLGDAGALVLMTKPELFGIEELPVRIELTGAKRGHSILGRGAAANAWPRIRVAVDLDVAKAAAAFVDTINAYAA
jgi:pyrimidine-specific ribonucleoside hydrolase